MNNLMDNHDRDILDFALRTKAAHRRNETYRAKRLTILLTIAATASTAFFIAWLST